MAVFVVTSQTKNPKAAKASIRYMTHRRDQEEEKITRTLYARFGIGSKFEAYRAIDNAKEGTTFYRLVLNFDPLKEDANRDLDLRRITEKTMKVLQRRFKNQKVQWFAAIHEKQKGTDLRHVHILALINGRFTPLDLAVIRNAATVQARLQRRDLDEQMERGTAVTLAHKQQFLAQASVLPQLSRPIPVRRPAGTGERRVTGGSNTVTPHCLTCGPATLMHRLTQNLFHCPSCGSITRNQGMGTEIVRGPKLELSLGKEVGLV
jgi:hypothetical protein